MAALLAEVMPAAVTTPLPPTPNTGNSVAACLLERMAERIARNREVLGLHYRSDTLTGKILAARTLDLLVQCPTVSDLLPGGAHDVKAAEWS